MDVIVRLCSGLCVCVFELQAKGHQALPLNVGTGRAWLLFIYCVTQHV